MNIFRKFNNILKLLTAIPVIIILALIFGLPVFDIVIGAIVYGPMILLVAGLVYGVVVLLRYFRDRKSLTAFKEDSEAMAMEKTRIWARRIGVFGIILWPVVFVAVLMYAEIGFLFAAVLASLCSLGCGAWSASMKSRYNVGFKENYVKAKLSEVFDNLTYEPEGKFDAYFIQRLDFFESAESVSGNDLINAAYKGRHFSQCDLRVREARTIHSGEDKSETVYTNVFQGRAKRFDFATEFRGRVQVVAKNFEGAKVKHYRGNWQAVETELAEFNKHFDVFALDPLDAMAVLTPQNIEAIFWLRQALSYPMAFYFIENSLLAFIAMGRDSFDASGKRTLLEEQELLERDIALVTGFMQVMYFKPQAQKSDTLEADTSLAARSAEERIAAATDTARRVGPSKVEEIARKVKRAANAIVGMVPMGIIAVYMASLVYGFLYLPDGAMLMEGAPDIGFMIILGITIVVSALIARASAPRNVMSSDFSAFLVYAKLFGIPLIALVWHLLILSHVLK
jgi:hypothetical protein